MAYPESNRKAASALGTALRRVGHAEQAVLHMLGDDACRRAMFTRFNELPAEREPWAMFLDYGADRAFVTEHMEAFGVSYDTARKDWRETRRGLLGTGKAPYLTPYVAALQCGDPGFDDY